MKAEEIDNSNPPFEVFFPGQRRHSKDAPYNFRHSVDPRLGYAQRLIKAGFFPDPDKLGLDHHDELPNSSPKIHKKRKLKHKLGDSKLPRRPFIITKTEEVMSNKEEGERVIARLTEKHSSKEYRQKRIESYQQSIKDWIDNEEESYRNRDIGCAKAAVEFYNNNHGTDYEIVETLGSYFKTFNGFLYHCNFRAQRKCLTSSGSRPSPKLFFAELFNDITPEAVKLCVILDEKSTRHSLPRDCEICPGHLYHPVDFVICSWLPK
ncbi:hypothetical protein KSS87_023633 [Heliosperma pusillum]|nr:hypothetical protein KSS87_023633 [Heliosperma pusillum]